MLSTKDIQKLFFIMQSRYGNKWTAVYDDPEIAAIALREWFRGLEQFPREWIRHGLDSWDDDWPPSLPQFQKACLPTPQSLGYDVEYEVLRRASGGDMYGFRRMPRVQTEKLLKSAREALMAEYTQDMIQNPQKYNEMQLEHDG